MKIGVLIKQVPDTETKIRIGPDEADIVRDGVKFVMNPYDEIAVEQALLVKEKVGGDSTVTAVSLGSARSVETLRTALAMGADGAVHLNDAAFEGQDVIATARALAVALRAESFDVVFAGKMAIDNNASTVATAVAETLDIAYVNMIQGFELAEDGSRATVRRRVEAGEEIIDCALPALFSCEKGLNEPRYASLTGIMKAKKKPVTVKSAADLGLGADQVGVAGSGARQTRVMALPERGGCKFIEGDAREAARQLVQALRNEAKVI